MYCFNCIAIAVRPGDKPNENSLYQFINATGRYTSFESYASNLIPNDTNTNPDVFLRDSCIGAAAGCTPSTIRVSLAYDGVQENAGFQIHFILPSIDQTGRFVAFASDATNMVSESVENTSGDTANIYVRDTCNNASGICTPTTTLASLAFDGSIANCGQNNQSMSADGRFIAFASLASNLVPGDSYAACGWKDIFVRDTCFGAADGCTPTTVRASVLTAGLGYTEANSISDYPRMSSDGHYVIFLSSASNLTSNGVSGNTNLMVFLAKTGYLH